MERWLFFVGGDRGQVDGIEVTEGEPVPLWPGAGCACGWVRLECTHYPCTSVC